jgi:hypothetical protein
MDSAKDRLLKRLLPWFEDREISDPISNWYGRYRHLTEKLTNDRWPGNLFQRIETTNPDWLIILDACRYDVLADVADDAVVQSAISPASQTAIFLEAANEASLFSDYVYATAHAKPSMVDPGAKELVPVHEEEWVSDLYTCPPLPALEHSLEFLDRGESVVTHLLQPHWPHVVTVDGETRPVPKGLHPALLGHDEAENFNQVLLTEMSKPDGFNRAKQSYRAAVQSVWQLVRDFAHRETEAGRTVAVTADHGELFGERGFVSHPPIRIKPLVQVPWVLFEPGRSRSIDDEVSVSTREKLEALGYVS